MNYKTFEDGSIEYYIVYVVAGKNRFFSDFNDARDFMKSMGDQCPSMEFKKEFNGVSLLPSDQDKNPLIYRLLKN